MSGVSRHRWRCPIVQLGCVQFCEGRIFETLIQNVPFTVSICFPREEDDFVSMHCALFEAIVRAQVNRKGVYMTSDVILRCPPESAFCSNHDRFLGCVHAYFVSVLMIQNADPKRPSREYCSCFPREEDDFVSIAHCSSSSDRKGVYMTSFKRGYM